jgi:hypothetical protein
MESQADRSNSPAFRGEQRENRTMAPVPRRGYDLLLHVLVLTVVAGYLFPRIDRGWIPHDEGLIGQAAERVLYGELPHLDFDDAYTGGQAMLHALVFRFLGVSSYATRVTLFVFTLLFTSATYLLASRVAASRLPLWSPCWRWSGACRTTSRLCRHGTTFSSPCSARGRW